ncbi:cytochrome P450 [Gilbertella persicaria]|uniref:cytochrome P450 n=1 Tax=Gilbertella persicaria TaxID=101096 RepID=UPI00221FE359|nr:cytochrome P450 [Gilbertella persicaria]KAI8063424.1 cytochrome P450 [Gilbertella persicaria]
MSLQTQLSVQKLLDLYQAYIVPRLTQKNKTIGISTAVALSLVYFIRNRILKPPKSLRRIPYIGYFTILGSFIRGESQWDFDHRVLFPMLESKCKDGIYMKPTALGWTIFVTTPEHAKVVFLKTVMGRFVNGPNLVFLNGPHWKSQRKVANPAFHRSMPVNLFGQLTLKLFDVIEKDGPKVDFSDLMQRWTLDAIGQAGFGFNFNALGDKDNDWVKTYNTINEGSTSILYGVFPGLDNRNSFFLPPRRRTIHRELDRFLGMIDQVILKKREQVAKGNLQNDALQENEKDLLTLMIESEQRGEGVLSDEELKSNVCIFFLAGHDTTANTLCVIVLYLALYPEMQQKAREEAFRVLGDEPRDILPTLDQTKELTYINQIMKEALRIRGPAPRGIPRQVTEDIVLSDKPIPKNSLISVDLFGIHHNKRVWKDPEVFDPDRFDEDNENNGPRPGMAWVPFSNGARQCIGMNFSLYEQRVLLAMLLRKYIWTLPEDSIHKHGIISQGHGIVGPAQVNINFKKRF